MLNFNISKVAYSVVLVENGVRCKNSQVLLRRNAQTSKTIAKAAKIQLRGR